MISAEVDVKDPVSRKLPEVTPHKLGMKKISRENSEELKSDKAGLPEHVSSYNIYNNSP